MIVFHVGMVKAGSSSIQRWLADNAAALASERNVHPMRIVRHSSGGSFDVVPVDGLNVKSELVGVELLYTQSDEESSRRAAARQTFERLDAHAHDGRTIVLTSEGYGQAFWNRDEPFLSELDALARVHPIRVAYYVRPQHTALEAAWRQWGYRLPIPPSEYLSRRVRPLQYLETLEQIEELAPNVSFEVRPFRDDLLEGGDVVVDFATMFLGAEELVATGARERRCNRGLPLELIVLLRDAEDTFWTSVHDNETLDQLRESILRWDIPESDQVRRSRQVLQAYCHRRFEPDNQRLIARLGWDTSHYVPALSDDDEHPDDGDDEFGALDRLWSPTASDAERALLLRALSALLPAPRTAPVRERQGAETDTDPTYQPREQDAAMEATGSDAMDVKDEDEVQRLQRHLRAMSAVNQSLHAQLEGRSVRGVGPSGSGDGDLLASTDQFYGPLQLRRASTASAWVGQLQLTSGGGETYLARRGSAVVVVEGRYRRGVSGLLAAALSKHLGEPRDITDEELERLDEGVRVEVLEGPRGRPFVVVGGRRITVRGLPLPYPVSAEEMQLFPEAAEVNVAAANVARAKFEGAFSGRYQLAQARAALARKGVVPTAAAFGRRIRRRLGGSPKG